jgi:hypothetical protein
MAYGPRPTETQGLAAAAQGLAHEELRRAIQNAPSVNGPQAPPAPVMAHFNELAETSARLERLLDSLSIRLSPICSTSRGDTASLPSKPVLAVESQVEHALYEINQRIDMSATRVSVMLDTLRI